MQLALRCAGQGRLWHRATLDGCRWHRGHNQCDTGQPARPRRSCIAVSSPAQNEVRVTVVPSHSGSTGSQAIFVPKEFCPASDFCPACSKGRLNSDEACPDLCYLWPLHRPDPPQPLVWAGQQGPPSLRPFLGQLPQEAATHMHRISQASKTKHIARATHSHAQCCLHLIKQGRT